MLLIIHSMVIPPKNYGLGVYARCYTFALEIIWMVVILGDSDQAVSNIGATLKKNHQRWRYSTAEHMKDLVHTNI